MARFKVTGNLGWHVSRTQTAEGKAACFDTTHMYSADSEYCLLFSNISAQFQTPLLMSECDPQQKRASKKYTFWRLKSSGMLIVSNVQKGLSLSPQRTWTCYWIERIHRPLHPITTAAQVSDKKKGLKIQTFRNTAEYSTCESISPGTVKTEAPRSSPSASRHHVQSQTRSTFSNSVARSANIKTRITISSASGATKAND